MEYLERLTDKRLVKLGPLGALELVLTRVRQREAAKGNVEQTEADLELLRVHLADRKLCEGSMFAICPDPVSFWISMRENFAYQGVHYQYAPRSPAYYWCEAKRIMALRMSGTLGTTRLDHLVILPELLLQTERMRKSGKLDQNVHEELRDGIDVALAAVEAPELDLAYYRDRRLGVRLGQVREELQRWQTHAAERILGDDMTVAKRSRAKKFRQSLEAILALEELPVVKPIKRSEGEGSAPKRVVRRALGLGELPAVS